MSFAAYEVSYDQGEPILLFAFTVGLATFYYTTADRPITYLGAVYTPAPISRAAIKLGAEVKQQTLKVTGPRDLGVAQLYVAEPPSVPVALTITAMHFTDPALQGQVDWVGRVMSCKWTGSQCELSCEPVFTSVQTLGLRRRYQIACAHVLYGLQCGLNPASYAVPGTLTVISGYNITATAWVSPPAAGLTFIGGFVTFDNGSYIDRRTINSIASGGVLTLDNILPGLVVGSQVIAYPGCNRSMTNCQAFQASPNLSPNGNILNYGGQPYIPSRNPMNGDPVY